MCLSILDFISGLNKVGLLVPTIGGVLFLVLSVVVYMAGIDQGIVSLLLGLLACGSIVVAMAKLYEDKNQPVLFGILAKYTMPIFLMHTLFAAPLRTVLFKLGIQNAALHVILGIAISFIGPMIAAIIMKKSKWLEFFLYPGKFVKLKVRGQ